MLKGVKMLSDHEINKVLAEVAGVDIDWYEQTGGEWWIVKIRHKGSNELGDRWEPLVNHNQFALVEAALREQGYDYVVDWCGWDGKHEADIHYAAGPVTDCPPHYIARHKDKLRAMAEAVVQMKEGQ